MSPEELSAAREMLRAAGEEATAALAALTDDFDAVVRASQAVNNNSDGHDPDGAANAFERAQISAVLDSVRRDLSEIDSALARVDAGTYGLCEQCGGAIAPERLQLRPAARLCIVCASTHRISASGAPRR